MKYILAFLLIAYLFSGLVYIFYVAIVKMLEQWSEVPWYAKAIVAPWMIFGVIIDFILNIVFSIVFLLSPPLILIWPPELFTGHCDRLLDNEKIQGKLARAWCKALNVFQPNHCHKRGM